MCVRVCLLVLVNDNEWTEIWRSNETGLETKGSRNSSGVTSHFT